MVVVVINEFVFTFAGRGSGRHGSPVSRCLLGLLRRTWSLAAGGVWSCCGRLLERRAQRLSLGSRAASGASLLALLQAFLHLPDPLLEGFEFGGLARHLLLPNKSHVESVFCVCCD